MAHRKQVPVINTDFDKTEALAICFRNLKGAKKKDLLLTARALSYLRNQPGCGSNRSVGEIVGVSGEVVRQFIALLDLPADVQAYLQDGKLGLEQGRRLWQLNRQRPSVVEDAARAMSSMTAMETRDLVEYLVRTPDASVQDALDALEEAKPKIAHEYYVVAVLDEETYGSLSSQAKMKRTNVNDLVSTVISDWLKGSSERPC